MTSTELVLTRLRRCLALALFALTVSSWPLWTGAGDFPQIPWAGALAQTPEAVDALLLTTLLLGSAAALFGPGTSRWTSRTATVQLLALAGLVALDQHRLQPWSYEFLLALSVMACGVERTGVTCLRGIVVSIYFWSGVSKVDPGFIDGHGQMLLDGLLRALHLSDAMWSDSVRQFAAAAMPAAELVIALLLTFARTRSVGLVASLMLHATLLLTLGPWGLDHEWGVLLWNLYFIAQNLILFRPLDTQPADIAPKRPIRGRVAIAITSAAVLLPLLNPVGLWDHWPSWSVYSAHPTIVRVFVRDGDVSRLPASLRPFVDPPLPLDDWRLVRLDQWSFSERGVPPYPQARWRIAVAAAIAIRAGLDHQPRVVLLRRKGWWGAAREELQAEGIAAIQTLTQDSWANTTSYR
ncbi:MAG: hypothetical protein KDA75_09005 [Planctomycetaceae bacterium]|nr:hypothetical protein [Planctomycetaceae bacterium]